MKQSGTDSILVADVKRRVNEINTPPEVAKPRYIFISYRINRIYIFHQNLFVIFLSYQYILHEMFFCDDVLPNSIFFE